MDFTSLLRVLWWTTFGEQRRYAIDETCGILYRVVSFGHGHNCAVPHTIITDFFVFVGFCQKYREGLVDFWRLSRQSRKFGANPRMCFCDFARAFDDERFSGMESGIVGYPRRNFRKPDSRDLSGVIQIIACLVEVICRFRRHSSRPSRRSSPINPVCSR